MLTTILHGTFIGIDKRPHTSNSPPFLGRRTPSQSLIRGGYSPGAGRSALGFDVGLQLGAWG